MFTLVRESAAKFLKKKTTDADKVKESKDKKKDDNVDEQLSIEASTSDGIFASSKVARDVLAKLRDSHKSEGLAGLLTNDVPPMSLGTPQIISRVDTWERERIGFIRKAAGVEHMSPGQALVLKKKCYEGFGRIADSITNMDQPQCKVEEALMEDSSNGYEADVEDEAGD